MAHWLKRLSALLVVGICMGAMWLLYAELRRFHLQDIRDAVARVPTTHIALAMFLTACNYVVLCGYDLIAVRSIGSNLPIRKVAFASFAGFVSSYNFGALLGGSSVRYRLYSSWGLSAVDVVRLIVMVGVTFWVGILALAGVVFTFDPFPIPASLHMPFQNVRPLGLALLAIVSVYLMLTAWWHKPFRIRSTEFSLPRLRTTLLQLIVAAIDIFFAAGCLYVLLPNGLGMSYVEFIGVYLLAMVAVIMSHVPGGVGVFELVLLTLAAAKTDENTVAALLVFRVVYYLLPLLLVAAMLIANEIRNGHQLAMRAGSQTLRLVGTFVPSLAAGLTLLAGTVLLWSGAMPVLQARLGPLTEIIPLPMMEASHFLGSVFGAALLLLARGLQRRLDSALWMTVCLLLGGIVVSLLKGFDFEEALLLSVVLVILLSFRKRFYRRGSLLHQRFTAGWIMAILLVLLCSVSLGLVLHRHVEYSASLWWQFAVHGDASRFIRASVGATSLLLLFAIRKLLQPQRTPSLVLSPQDLEAAAKILPSSSRTDAHLALLGDKHFLFNEDRTAFLMYAFAGKSWVAMGDPVGQHDECRELVWKFRELCDQFDAWPVFYQVLPESLPFYLDLGLKLLKLGEEARVPLADFSLEGSHRKDLRQAHNRGLREECRFEIVPAAAVEPLLPKLRSISDAWLGIKHGHEKSFSLGSFDESYLKRCPCAVVRRNDTIVAFANVWATADKSELSIDLMRYLPEPHKRQPSPGGADVGVPPFAPSGVMEFLFAELMLWGKAQEYAWFSLGMAPFSGIADRPLAPLWNRAAGLVFRHGEHFYSFEGLRSYKDKFCPVWTPKYLASPGGLALPGILKEVARLINHEHSVVRPVESAAS